MLPLFSTTSRFPPIRQHRRKRRHWRRRPKHVVSSCGALSILALSGYTTILLWTYHRLTSVFSYDNLRFEDPVTSQRKTRRRVLILIPSIPRTPETLCDTLQSILDHWSNGDDTTPGLASPQMLVHRHGDWNCPSGLSHHPQILVRQYPAHAPLRQTALTSNEQQTLDYLQLFHDAQQLIGIQQQQQQQQHNATTKNNGGSPYSYVLLLDDDVVLCQDVFGRLLPLLLETVSYTPTARPFGMAHFGRGSSGIFIPSHNLLHVFHNVLEDNPGLLDTMPLVANDTTTADDNVNAPIRHRSHHKPRKNIDKSLLEWALHKEQLCVVRPNIITMQHVGFTSSVMLGKSWEDVDQCGGATNNRAWQALSETALHPDFFSEQCVIMTASITTTTSMMADTTPLLVSAKTAVSSSSSLCSPFTSRMAFGFNSSTRRSMDMDMNPCQPCLQGYTGEDCGLPPLATSNIWIRRKHTAPIVVLLDGPAGNATVVSADAACHNLVNLYVLGAQPHDAAFQASQWLTPNIYQSVRPASQAFHEDLRSSPRFGALAFPVELLTLDRLLSPPELWTIKYYESEEDR